MLDSTEKRKLRESRNLCPTLFHHPKSNEIHSSRGAQDRSAEALLRASCSTQELADAQGRANEDTGGTLAGNNHSGEHRNGSQEHAWFKYRYWTQPGRPESLQSLQTLPSWHIRDSWLQKSLKMDQSFIQVVYVSINLICTKKLI